MKNEDALEKKAWIEKGKGSFRAKTKVFVESLPVNANAVIENVFYSKEEKVFVAIVETGVFTTKFGPNSRVVGCMLAMQACGQKVDGLDVNFKTINARKRRNKIYVKIRFSTTNPENDFKEGFEDVKDLLVYMLPDGNK